VVSVSLKAVVAEPVERDRGERRAAACRDP
jgi:hypothetical protein